MVAHGIIIYSSVANFFSIELCYTACKLAAAGLDLSGITKICATLVCKSLEIEFLRIDFVTRTGFLEQ